MAPAPSFLLLMLSVVCLSSLVVRAFDVRRHLGTKTRYAYRLSVIGSPSIYKAADPEGYDPVHLYLLARHGTRWPTGDRMRQINSLEGLFRDARNTADHPWTRNWTAPFPNVALVGGELHPLGADELWGLAYRLRKRFPSLSGQDYLPKRFPVVSTQVARTAASASAFTSGFFPDVGSRDPADDSPTVNHVPPRAPKPGDVGTAARPGSGEEETAMADGGPAGWSRRAALQEPRRFELRAVPHEELDETLREQPDIRRPQAVAISMAPKDADPLLRFFDVCPAYAQHDEYTEKWIGSWMQGNWSRLAPALERRLGLSRDASPCEVEALWQLCLLEAGLYGVTDRACSLFEPEEVLMLEWVDDTHLLETQSYGAAINYDIAAPLLRDATEALKNAAAAGAGAGPDSDATAPVARLMFAHCETLVPLASLLGLFRPPASPPPEAPPHLLAAAVSPAAAQRHLQQLDSTEDLHMAVAGLRELNGRSGPDSGSPARGGSGGSGPQLGSEDSHVCYKGRPWQPSDWVPPPPGWQPMFACDDSRLFKGARIAPFGANLALVLYRRREGGGAPGGRPKHLVRLLYNEQVMPVPGCRGTVGADGGSGAALDCDLEEFLQLVQNKTDPDALKRLCGTEGKVVLGDGGAAQMYNSVALGDGLGGSGVGAAAR